MVAVNARTGALVALMIIGWGASASAQEAKPAAASKDATPAAQVVQSAPAVRLKPTDARPTIQRRFAPKRGLLYLHVSSTMHVRDDFYDSWGVGGDLGYFFSERLGGELRVLKMQSSLDDAAQDLKERLGITPDARPQDLWLLAGARYSPGYGKLLMWSSWVLHFDPQLTIHGGVASAEARWLPTFQAAASLFLHFRWNIKAKVDLGVSVQGERRDRGWVWTTGFAPVVGIGWGVNL